MKLITLNLSVMSKQALQFAGFYVQEADEEDDLLQTLSYSNTFMCIVLGLERKEYPLVKRLRNRKCFLPIVVITRAKDSDARSAFLNAGADRVMSQPSNYELVAVTKTCIRRCCGQSHILVKVGNVEINLTCNLLKVCGQYIHLTPNEWKTLEIITLYQGKVAKKTFIYDQLYPDYDCTVIPKIIDVFVCKIRMRIRRAGGDEKCIETDWGVGFKLLKEKSNES